MNTTKKYKWFIKRLSLRQQLLLFTCTLLLFVITAYSLTSYIGVKRAALVVGRERLQTLTRQLSTSLQQSVQTILASHVNAANGKLKHFLSTGAKVPDTTVLNELKKLGKDSGSVFIALLGPDKKKIAGIGNESKVDRIILDKEWELFTGNKDTAILGKLYAQKDTVYYPVIASITDREHTLGYLIRWKLVAAKPKSVSQLTDLMGSDGALLFANRDGSLWTDMMHQVKPLPVSSLTKSDIVEYNTPSGKQMFVAIQPLANTQWAIFLEFSKQRMTEAANRFLYWDIIIGLLLIVIGIAATWLMSIHITRPLKKLTTATSAIADGNYSWLVDINRYDEVGILAGSFNNMVEKIHKTQEELEKKVQERTRELTSANKELEAFSYSVSHDLRAPLRAISGYATILKEDYGPGLDQEASRIIDTITANAATMGQLIDDLISFSITGKKKISGNIVDMKSLAESCLQQILENTPGVSYEVKIDDLPPCYGDLNLLRQVWMNLIGNAVKYSSRQPRPQIFIGFGETQTSIQYFVRDNGIGFDMQYAHKLFHVFQRLHSQTEFEGTGIGLALVKRIIQKHNGQVWATSIPEKETVFYFNLPKEKTK